jgi:ribonucleotide monophosphatase NagD (HAD superfamily)
MDNSKFEVPAIAIDLDGVIWKQGQFIEGSQDTLKMLCKDMTEIDSAKYQEQTMKMPFLFVTNSGASTEQKVADFVNEKLGIHDLYTIPYIS